MVIEYVVKDHFYNFFIKIYPICQILTGYPPLTGVVVDASAARRFGEHGREVE